MLSGGQQQRVALARGIVTGPTCSCSASRSATSKQLQRQLDIAVLIVTHDQIGAPSVLRATSDAEFLYLELPTF